ncbi:MAG TPA: serine acetyltransferase, partial [Clostridiales bacterium]|nr:serine acetyltransferase [Clostridiales bacterium]
MGSYNDKEIQNVVDLILKDYEDDRVINAIDIHHQPDKEVIISVVDNLLKILYPGYLSDKVFRVYTLKNTMSATIEDVIFHLKKQVAIVLKYTDEFAAAPQDVLDKKAKELTLAFMKKIPEIRASLETDVDAGFEGDPAAKSKAEIIFSYPGLFAVSVYRIAHELHLLRVPMIPRMMTEYAH